MKLRIGLAAVLLAAFAFSCPAGAAINSIGAFAGTLSETWESFPNYGTGPNIVNYMSSPTTIMNGGASVSDPGELGMVIYQPSSPNAGFGLGYFGAANVSDGLRGMGFNDLNQTCTINFAGPVTSFGAYWGASLNANYGIYPDVALSFFGADGGILGTDRFTYSGNPAGGPGNLEWHGWSFGQDVAAISYTGDYVVIDGLQANGEAKRDVPELPASALAAIPGVIGLAWRRRK